MTDGPDRRWEDLVQWADDVLDEQARASEHLSDGELRDRAVIETAAFYVLADGWLVGDPDDPETRDYLIRDEQHDAEFADAVLDRMREIGKERGWM